MKGAFGLPFFLLLLDFGQAILTDRMPKPKKNISRKSTKTTAVKRVGRTSKWNPDHCQVVEKYVFDKGQIEGVWDLLGVSKATFHNWFKAKLDLKAAVLRGRVSRDKLVNREFNAEVQMAVDTVVLIMQGYYKEETKQYFTASRTDQVDEHGGLIKKGELMYRTKDVREEVTKKWFPPDPKALERVLGKESLRQTLFLDQIKKYVPDITEDIYPQLFGSGTMGWELPFFGDKDILNPKIDLVKLRFMEIVIQKAFDDQALSIQQWLEFNVKLKSMQGSIADRIETRAQKLLKGQSYAEIMEDYSRRFQMLLSVVRNVMDDTLPSSKKSAATIAKMMTEIVDRINELKSEQAYPFQSN